MLSGVRAWLSRRSVPVRVGIAFATAGLLLALVGVARGNVPLNPRSVFLAILISAGSWGIVSWAVAMAAVDVETDLGDGDAND